jgi:hypothetical protein
VTFKRYTHMSQLKTALRNGEITRAEYSRHQEEIRKNREIEFERAKQDLAAGRISKAQYNQRIADIKHKYETGAEISRDVPTAPPPIPSGSSASSPASFNNMKELKSALSEGRITREQYRTHQQEIRNKRAAEYDRIKADYRAGKIDRNTYNRLIEQTRQKYEGN